MINLNSDYSLFTISKIQQSGEKLLVELDNDSISMMVGFGQFLLTEVGKRKKVTNLKNGDKVYIKIFDKKGKSPKMPTDKNIEKIFFSEKQFQQLPNFVLNN